MRPKFKRVPRFWWKFSRDTKTVVVRSDQDGFPVVGTFPYAEVADFAIEEAEELIADLKAGRRSMKQLPVNGRESL